VRLQTCILRVTCSNLARNTNYLSCFFYSLRQNCVTASVKPRPLPLACFPLSYSVLILALGTAQSELPGSSINKNYNKRSQRKIYNIQPARHTLYVYINNLFLQRVSAHYLS